MHGTPTPLHHPALALFRLIGSDACAFNWPLRRTLYHLYHSIWGVTAPAQLPNEIADAAYPQAEVPWLTPLLKLIRQDRQAIANAASVAASRTLTDVLKYVSDDEGSWSFLRVCLVSRALSSFPAHIAAEDDKAKRLREIEDRANRTMDKDFFKGQHNLLTTSIAMSDSR